MPSGLPAFSSCLRRACDRSTDLSACTSSAQHRARRARGRHRRSQQIGLIHGPGRAAHTHTHTFVVGHIRHEIRGDANASGRRVLAENGLLLDAPRHAVVLRILSLTLLGDRRHLRSGGHDRRARVAQRVGWRAVHQHHRKRVRLRRRTGRRRITSLRALALANLELRRRVEEEQGVLVRSHARLHKKLALRGVIAADHTPRPSVHHWGGDAPRRAGRKKSEGEKRQIRTETASETVRKRCSRVRLAVPLRSQLDG